MNNRQKRKVFCSFHFDNDIFRAQQVRNMGVVDVNEPVTLAKWENIRRTTAGVERWIDENMKGKSCVVVLIGSGTAFRPWVNYEIKKAWQERKGLFGIHVHGLKASDTGVSVKGANPFDRHSFMSMDGTFYVPRVYEPREDLPYTDICTHLSEWIERAVVDSKQF